jgi:carboxyl-terminal processing protease
VELVRRFADGGGAPVSWSLTEAGGRHVGYLKLSDFSASSRGDVERALRDLDARGADAYVLDVRHNPGGVFEGALEIAGLFSGRDAVVARVTSRGSAEEVFRSRIIGDDSAAGKPGAAAAVAARNAAGRYTGGAVVSADAPLAVVVDSGSASSSEVLGGALRDNCRGVIVGTTHSFGKGLIQGVFGLSDGGGVVVTVARYRTPGGGEIQGAGLTPAIPIADGPIDSIVRLVRGQSAGATVDFTKVEEELRMCRAAAAESSDRARIFPASPFGRS